MNLNAEQQAAAEVTSQNALILAGPGTGKTTALVGRYAHLIENGHDPKTILCCTFAKKAAEELGVSNNKLASRPELYRSALSIRSHSGS